MTTENKNENENENENNTIKEHTIRHADGGTITIKNYTRGKAIKLWCVECCGFSENPLKWCNDKKCPLYPFRGNTTKNTQRLSEETKNKNIEKLKKYHETKQSNKE